LLPAVFARLAADMPMALEYPSVPTFTRKTMSFPRSLAGKGSVPLPNEPYLLEKPLPGQ
jgi:hypothetical protein